MWDLLITNARLATMDPDRSSAFGMTDADQLAIKDGRIAFIGQNGGAARERLDAGGRWLTPGLVDAHSHLIFAGGRVGDFHKRLSGESYEAIAKAGGGILSTVRATRAADAEALFLSALPRLQDMIHHGVTTIEIKSGYGLDRDTELRMLACAARLGETTGIRVSRTFLGGHMIAPEYREDRKGYIDFLCDEMIPEIAAGKAAEAVDAFCETIGLSALETDRLFTAARRHGLKVKLHAEQLSNSHGAALAARYGALSADHLEYLDADGIAAMKAAGTVAMLLPAAFYFLGETRKPPVSALRDAGVPMAVASDCNPGSAPLRSPLILLNMACILFGLTPEEALAGMTVHAARALGLQDVAGKLAVGHAADIALWDISEPAELCYWIGGNPLHESFAAGRRLIHRGEKA